MRFKIIAASGLAALTLAGCVAPMPTATVSTPTAPVVTTPTTLSSRQSLMLLAVLANAFSNAPWP